MRSAIISRYLRRFGNSIAEPIASGRSASVAACMAVTASAIAALFGASTAQGYVEMPPFRWREGYFRLSTLTSYYQTTANYADSRNEFQNLPNGGSLKEYSLRMKARYSATNSLSAYVGGDFVNVQSRDPAIGYKENPAFTNAFAGFDVRLLDGSWKLVGEIEGSYNVDQATYARNSAMGSDGVHYGKGSLYLLKPLGFVNLLASAGGQYRAEGLAARALWSIAAEKPFARRFLIGAGFDGYESLVSDALYPRDRKQLTDRVNAGSFRHYGFNDALIQAGAWFGWAPISALQMRVGVDQSLTGQRSAAGLGAFFSLSWNFDPRPEPDAFAANPYARQRDREDARSKAAVKRFETQDENAEDALFYEDPPRKQPAPSPAPPPSGGSLLDDAEKKLERRR